jgi:hypothetical protein
MPSWPYQPQNKILLLFIKKFCPSSEIQTIESETIQKRCLVASKRLFASFNKGGLQIQHPKKVAEEL